MDIKTLKDDIMATDISIPVEDGDFIKKSYCAMIDQHHDSQTSMMAIHQNFHRFYGDKKQAELYDERMETYAARLRKKKVSKKTNGKSTKKTAKKQTTKEKKQIDVETIKGEKEITFLAKNGNRASIVKGSKTWSVYVGGKKIGWRKQEEKAVELALSHLA